MKSRLIQKAPPNVGGWVTSIIYLAQSGGSLTICRSIGQWWKGKSCLCCMVHDLLLTAMIQVMKWESQPYTME